MADRLSSFFKESRKQMNRLRDSIKELKTEQKEAQKELQKEVKEPKKKKQEELIVKFSMGNVAKATATVIGLVLLLNFLTEIQEIVLAFFVSILFAAALDPTVDALEKRKIPRGVSVIVIFLILLFILGFFLSQLIPLIATQLLEVARSLTVLVERLGNGELNIPFQDTLQPFIDDFLSQIDRDSVVEQAKSYLENFSDQLNAFAGDTIGFIKTVFDGVFNFFLVLVLTFFLVINEESVDGFFVSLFPSKHGKYIVEKMDAVKIKVGYWLRGQIMLMLLMFTVTFIIFSILGLNYALTLAMMAGIAELVPIVGPILAAVPAFLVAFNQSPWLVLWLIGAIIIIQQIEGNVLIPLVMKKAVGLSPIVVILAILIGFTKFGVTGAIIAIPVATTLSIFVSDYVAKQK